MLIFVLVLILVTHLILVHTAKTGSGDHPGTHPGTTRSTTATTATTATGIGKVGPGGGHENGCEHCDGHHGTLFHVILLVCGFVICRHIV
ncbi:MAG: hypothetical protein P8Y96_02460 [Desulfuromonadales bacterium]